jgi:hypothetical protein
MARLPQTDFGSSKGGHDSALLAGLAPKQA